MGVLMKQIITLFSCVVLLATVACSPREGQNTYKDGEVGISRSVEFGTVHHVREIQIDAKNTGTGLLLGAGVGAGAGSYVGNGSGNVWATAGAAVIGAVAGTVAENAINDRKGLEYIVIMQSGETKTVVQEKNDSDVVFKAGDHVMLQYCDNGEHGNRCTDGKQYQRLLPIDKLPPFVKKRKKIVKG